MLPKDYTQHEKIQPVARHRLIANGWHLGVAKFVLSAVLCQVLNLTPSAASSPALPPRSSTLTWTINAWLKFVEDHHFQTSEFLN
eukprot:6489898-Amphidinium_carterae.1